VILQSRWRNAAYVIRRSEKIIYPGLGTEIRPGLIAKFKGPQRLFDSEVAAVENNWSDEEREFVEKRLLGHKDFGRGIYMAPGQILTEEQEQHVRNKSVLVKPKQRCTYISATGGEIRQCPEEALLGEQFCSIHDPDKQQVVKGMLTTQGAPEPEMPEPAIIKTASD